MVEGGTPRRGLEETPAPKRAGRLRNLGYVLGGLITAATAGSAHFQHDAQEVAGVTAEALEGLVVDLETELDATEDRCAAIANQAAAEARAEANAVRTLVLGYLLAQGGKSAPRATQATLARVLEQLDDDLSGVEGVAVQDLMADPPPQQVQRAAPPAPRRMKQAHNKLKAYSKGEEF